MKLNSNLNHEKKKTEHWTDSSGLVWSPGRRCCEKAFYANQFVYWGPTLLFVCFQKNRLPKYETDLLQNEIWKEKLSFKVDSLAVIAVIDFTLNELAYLNYL